MGFFRIGDKLLSKEKLWRAIERIFALRTSGLSQQEVAAKLGIDRTFISRLETIAEVRKGGSIAVIGFPLDNTEELRQVAEELGVEFIFLMNDEERWQYIQSMNGLEFLNELMGIITELNDYDTVIMIGSDMRIRLAEAILGDKIVGYEIGKSPIEGDVPISVDTFKKLILSIKGGSGYEEGSRG